VQEAARSHRQRTGGMSRERQTSNVVAGLRAAAPILEKNGMTAIVEVLNTFVDHAGYFLYYIRDGAEIVDRVGSPNVKLLFDLYHTQIMEGNLISNLRTYIKHVDTSTSEITPAAMSPAPARSIFRNVFKAIYELGDRYNGLRCSGIPPAGSHRAGPCRPCASSPPSDNRRLRGAETSTGVL